MLQTIHLIINKLGTCLDKEFASFGSLDEAVEVLSSVANQVVDHFLDLKNVMLSKDAEY